MDVALSTHDVLVVILSFLVPDTDSCDPFPRPPYEKVYTAVKHDFPKTFLHVSRLWRDAARDVPGLWIRLPQIIIPDIHFSCFQVFFEKKLPKRIQSRPPVLWVTFKSRIEMMAARAELVEILKLALPWCSLVLELNKNAIPIVNGMPSPHDVGNLLLKISGRSADLDLWNLLKNSERLKTLDIEGFNKINPASWRSVGLWNVEKFSVCGGRLPQSLLDALGGGFLGLLADVTIRLNHADDVKKILAAVASTSHHFQCLKSLDISLAGGLTDRDIEKILIEFHKIERFKCALPGTTVLEALSQPMLPRLRELDMLSVDSSRNEDSRRYWSTLTRAVTRMMSHEDPPRVVVRGLSNAHDLCAFEDWSESPMASDIIKMVSSHQVWNQTRGRKEQPRVDCKTLQQLVNLDDVKASDLLFSKAYVLLRTLQAEIGRYPKKERELIVRLKDKWEPLLRNATIHWVPSDDEDKVLIFQPGIIGDSWQNRCS